MNTPPKASPPPSVPKPARQGAFRAAASRFRRTSGVRAIRDVTADAQRSRLPQMAAALSYRTIFGIIPVLVVSLVALSFFVTEQDVAKVLTQATEFTGLSGIAVADPLPDAAAAAPDAEPTPEADAGRLDIWIHAQVARLRHVPYRTIGFIGVVLLLYAAISMLVEVERAFNQIYRVSRGRSWVRRLTQYWTILTLGSLGLVATFYVGERFKMWVVELVEFRGGGAGDAVAITFLGYLTTVFISASVLLLAYMAVPNTRVRFTSALAGAVIAAVLWEAGKWGFTQYLRYSAGYARLYGSLALIPLFLLWVYLTWLIVLLGLQVTYRLQHGRRQTIPVPEQSTEPVLVDPALILPLMGALARRFEHGRTATPAELARDLGVQPPAASRMLEELERAAMVHRVKVGERNEAFALSRPPHRISADDVLTIGERLAAPDAPKEPRLGEITQTLCRVRHEAVAGKTMAALIDNGQPAPQPAEPQPAPD